MKPSRRRGPGGSAALAALAAVAVLGTVLPGDPARPASALPVGSSGAAQSPPEGEAAPGSEFIPRGGTCAPLDVAFLIDSTGSMDPAIANVESEITGFLGEIEEASGGDYRIALVEFGLGVSVRVPFSASNRAEVEVAVPSLASGGGETPEAWDEALRTAVDGRTASQVGSGDQDGDFSGGWRTEANKLIVLVTDAPASGFDDEAQPDDLTRAETAARDALRAGIRVTTVFVPNENSDADAAPQLTRVAGLGGGAYFETSEDGGNLTDGLDLAVRTCGADSDGDGLFDNWETEGIDSDGDGTLDLDLPAMGSDPEHKDLFIEVDWMTEPDPGACWHIVWCPVARDLAPDPAALQKIAEAFATAPVDNPDGDAGVTVHFDAGDRTPSVGGLDQRFRRGGPLAEADFADPLITATVDADLTTDAYDATMAPFDDLHDRSVDAVRRVAFTWVLYGATINPGDSDAGLARGLPSDAVVIAGAHMDSSPKEAATVMHELGHTLDLRHGGADSAYNKPNYLSVMNYAHALRNGLVVGGRENQLKYSEWELPTIDEGALDETTGMRGDRGAPHDVQALHPCEPQAGITQEDMRPFFIDSSVDWNCDGDSTDRALSAAVRAEEDRSLSPERLTSWNDWAHLSFTGGVRGGLGTASEEVPTEGGFNEENYVGTPKAHAVSVQGGGAVRAAPGSEDLSFPIDVLNIGTEADTYGITVDGPEGTEPRVSVDSIEVAAGESAQPVLIANVPEGARVGDHLTVTAALTSTATDELMATTVVTITVVAEPADATDGSLTVTPDHVEAGQTVTVTADGFAPGTSVIIWTEPTVADEVVTPADDDGAVIVEMEIPDTAQGPVQVNAGGYTPGEEPDGTVPPLATDRPAQGPPRVLTGSVEVTAKRESVLHLWPYAAAALVAVLLVIGVYLLVRRRRGRSAGGGPDGGGPAGGGGGPPPDVAVAVDAGPEPEIVLHGDIPVRLLPAEDAAADDLDVRLH